MPRLHSQLTEAELGWSEGHFLRPWRGKSVGFVVSQDIQGGRRILVSLYLVSLPAFCFVSGRRQCQQIVQVNSTKQQNAYLQDKDAADRCSRPRVVDERPQSTLICSCQLPKYLHKSQCPLENILPLQPYEPETEMTSGPVAMRLHPRAWCMVCPRSLPFYAP